MHLLQKIIPAHFIAAMWLAYPGRDPLGLLVQVVAQSHYLPEDLEEIVWLAGQKKWNSLLRSSYEDLKGMSCNEYLVYRDGFRRQSVAEFITED